MPGIHFGFDLRSSPSGASHADLVAAALDMCEWADKLGVATSARVLEHHGSPDGYNPSPITFAAAIAGRTRGMAISAVIILPLYHPIRLAEDLALLDLVSRGRVTFIFGAGYRAEEFAALGVDLADRGRLMEAGVEVLKKAWTGEPFEFQGRSVRVTPRPFQRPRPPIILGGASKAAARRAARVADGFAPTDAELMQVYRDERVALGKDPGPEPRPAGPIEAVVAVSEDPAATWAQVGSHCLHEMNTYSAWLSKSAGNVPGFWPVTDVEALRATGRYLVLTPEQCLERARAQRGAITIQPLLGGIAPELGWHSLRLIESEVLPKLR
jgi:alkanesulfonate monooxygenase SsuD/methylene tetrahydromethanopterin reductase-like flavin-dependent oxidoreductase (luciferase family)